MAVYGGEDYARFLGTPNPVILGKAQHRFCFC